MNIDLSALSISVSQVLADTSSDDSGNFAFLFLFAGPLFYAYVYFRYRNTRKRHKHEAETEGELVNVQAQDAFVRSLKGVSNSTMTGANNRAVRGGRLGLG